MGNNDKKDDSWIDDDSWDDFEWDDSKDTKDTKSTPKNIQKCSNCGADIDLSISKFCTECGNKVTDGYSDIPTKPTPIVLEDDDDLDDLDDIFSKYDNKKVKKFEDDDIDFTEEDVFDEIPKSKQSKPKKEKTPKIKKKAEIPVVDSDDDIFDEPIEVEKPRKKKRERTMSTFDDDEFVPSDVPDFSIHGNEISSILKDTSSDSYQKVKAFNEKHVKKTQSRVLGTLTYRKINAYEESDYICKKCGLPVKEQNKDVLIEEEVSGSNLSVFTIGKVFSQEKCKKCGQLIPYEPTDYLNPKSKLANIMGSLAGLSFLKKFSMLKNAQQALASGSGLKDMVGGALGSNASTNVDYSNSNPSGNLGNSMNGIPKKKGKKILKAILTIVVIGAVGFFGFMFLMNM